MEKELRNGEMITEFLENQKAQINLDTESLKFKHEELKANTRLAEKAMELQAQHLSRQPEEGRKSITRIGYIIGGLVLIFFIFVIFCLYLKEEAFLIGFLKNAGCFRL